MTLPPPFVIRALAALRRALLRLADGVVPADIAVLDRATGVMATMGLHTAARLGVADHLATGPQTAEELARALRVDPDALHRVLRLLASIGIFSLDSAGRFANNRLSSSLRTDSPVSVRRFVEYWGIPGFMRACVEFGRMVQTGRSAFESAHGKSLWRYFEDHPDDGAVFAGGMTDVTRRAAPFITAAYPFSEVQTVCDVAGGRGTLLAEILVQHPHLRGVLFDEAQVLDLAPPLLEERRKAATSTSSRISCTTGTTAAASPSSPRAAGP
jgi:hypothetical protein